MYFKVLDKIFKNIVSWTRLVVWHLEDVFEGVTLQRLTANPPDISKCFLFFGQVMISIFSKSFAAKCPSKF